MNLSEYVRILGRGPGRSRSLSFEEAQDAMRLMLSGEAAPEAIGALLMLLRMKGETCDEIAGFAAAAQAALPEIGPVDLDWPSYAAGRTRGAPWFLLSARLVASTGARVLIHGWNGSNPETRAGLAAAGIPIAEDMESVSALLNAHGIAYLPLERAHPALFTLLQLRETLGLRSCINTVCRMLNPGRANSSVQGVFHPSYRRLQTDAAALLGWQNLSVIKGGGGEFERHPGKVIRAEGLRSGSCSMQSFPVLCEETRRLSAASASLSDLIGGTALPAFETQIIHGTAQIALDTLGHRDCARIARSLWQASPVTTAA